MAVWLAFPRADTLNRPTPTGFDSPRPPRVARAGHLSLVEAGADDDGGERGR